MKFVTASRDGTVKIWMAHNLALEKTIWVAEGSKDNKASGSENTLYKASKGAKKERISWVTCIAYMTGSQRLAVGTLNNMITFYDLNSTNYNTPVSRFVNLLDIPMCMEYYKWPKNNDGKFETLIIGDNHGAVHMYNFSSSDWHSCQLNPGSKYDFCCHAHEIK